MSAVSGALALGTGPALLPPLALGLSATLEKLSAFIKVRELPNCAQAPLHDTPICDTSLPLYDRASSMVDLLSIDEKFNLTSSFWPPVERLGLPSFVYWNEALHGIATSPGVVFNDTGDFSFATSFPQPILTAAAFDDDLVHQIATVVSIEGRSYGNAGRSGLSFFTPNVNPFRDPRWGRGQETAGEDPFHVSNYARAIIAGMEGPSSSPFKRVGVTCKHAVAYDVEKWGDTDRFHFDAHVTVQELAEYHTPPFEACTRDAKAGAIMCSYNALNGRPTCLDPWLLTTLLRDHWHWNDVDNYVVGDCATLDAAYLGHNYTKTPEETAALALKAGLDMDCGAFFPGYLPSAYQKGLITEDDLDRALRRGFSSGIKLGYFDNADHQSYRSISWSAVNTVDSQKLALKAAVSGMTLLKNLNGTLPLSAPQHGSTLVIALVGDWANATTDMQGGYSGPAPYLHSPLWAFSQQGNVKVKFVPFTNNTAPVAAAAEASDVVIYIGGINSETEAEGLDRISLAWNSTQVAQIEAAARVGKPMILVQTGGGQIDDSLWVSNPNISAIIWAGYPGQDGGVAIADVVFGHQSPAGRLPVTQYPAQYADLPMTDMNLRPDGKLNPGRTYMWYTGEAVIPFGYGLHFTSFLAEASLRGPSTYDIASLVAGCRSMTYLDQCHFATFDTMVSNSGQRTSDYSALAFLSGSFGPAPHPIKRLVAYSRLKDVQPGASQNASMDLTLGSLARWDEEARRILYPGSYRIVIDVQPELAEFTFTLTGEPYVLEAWPAREDAMD